MRFLTLLILFQILLGTSAFAASNLSSPELKQLQKEKEMRLIQRRTYTFQNPETALRLGIRTLEYLGFYIDQAYPYEYTVSAVNGDTENLMAAVKILKKTKNSNKYEVWFNLKLKQKTVEAPGPYQTFFKTFDEQPWKAADAE